MSFGFLGLIAAVCMSAAAQADTVTNFVPVSTGVFDDPGLAGFTTWAMRVTADTDWTNADLNISLDSGALNHVAPAFLGSPNGVNNFGDTAGMAPTSVNGDITGGFNGVVGFAGDHFEGPDHIRTSWFTTETDDIGMVTLSSDANGILRFRTVAGEQVGDGGIGINSGILFTIRNGGIDRIPEPTTLVLAGLGLCGVLALRRRS
ncbi:MAG: PEP-CTERM sorting domain-containing protein [Pirellulaceae bacterium]